MNFKNLLETYKESPHFQQFKDHLKTENCKINLKGLVGSSLPLFAANSISELAYVHVFVLPDKESAAYFANDLEGIFEEKFSTFTKKKILFFPTSYKHPYEIEATDNVNLQLRTEVLERLSTSTRKSAIVTYPEALAEKVVSKKYLAKNTLKLKIDEQVSIDFMIDILMEYGFERSDFVVEPGQFSVRGGIIDVFSFADDFPYRIEFSGEEIESIRTFDPIDQLSKDKLSRITIVPNVQDRMINESRESFLDYLHKNSILWIENIEFTADKIEQEYKKANESFDKLESLIKRLKPEELFTKKFDFNQSLNQFTVIEFNGNAKHADFSLKFNTRPQPSFNKKFDLLISDLKENSRKGFENIILSDNPKQIDRLYSIFEDMQFNLEDEGKVKIDTIVLALHEGFIDDDLKIACYTDHQLFDRYHRFHLKSGYKSKEAITLKELYDLTPGDFVTHVDHGIGRFEGLEKIENNGIEQEAIRISYKNNDLLYISIHSLHRISKFVGKDGSQPVLNKLGTNAWNTLKNRTKQRVKDIAKDLIKLYAERKSAEGFQFMPDTYLQHELEASFIYEDTPDQLKATIDVKRDLEQPHPMDRLVCGDVGFGKTEIAIRAAFKVVTDSKQVAILVPTTILALQHYKTFSDRLKDFPCKVEYINRFKSAKQQKEILEDLKAGKIDILIGTHRLAGKDIDFKDLGLLIIDEEQKFGVAAKEKLKQLKINVDTLTLTATPIPRTLQFSLMGARDLSIINTPPPNRYPVQTEIRLFSEEIIRDGILYEVSRGGQVFFVNNRVQNIQDVKVMIERFCPGVSVGVAHGQMDGKTLERRMLEFINGDYDVLLATTIIESGLDIPNVNTIFINDAQNYGLSDLHQLRGRVGRSNKKAFCYLLAPPLSVLTDEARKRLKAIEDFADLGSGFNIAMRDMDIRGTGNMLGGEQSGFISEIGFEMYNQILDEAIMELKENEFKDIFKTDVEEKEFVKDCQIETDMEILIPDRYISNITERLSLYKELDNAKDEKTLSDFREKLIDRFGPLPKQTQELINAVQLRWLAKKIGFERLILKNKRMTGYFIGNEESVFYQSKIFSNVLKFVQNHSEKCKMREKNGKLTLTFENISKVNMALLTLQDMTNVVDNQLE
ncbi:MAG: transcription-repair coupling factor [Bacteroidetes bacterium HGW-Bacteroidetes-17]|nr:MAG: transcription-repair coupling factor [Bacteroidetes bacterium HGW-Bacteroidetes-17]